LLVRESGTAIARAIAGGASPEGVCEELGLGDKTCDFCLDVVSYIEGVLVDTKVLEAVIAAVDAQYCAPLPGSFSALCDALVAQYVPTIVQLLEQGLGPTTVCSRLGYCATDA
jgi:hypothetical protein